MKRIYSTFLIVVLCCFSCYAQVNEVELVVNSSGENKEQAINNGLRMAIEQSFGTFVSSNTALLNDELVKDEIVTVSSGTIKKYSELSSIVLPSGEVSVSLKVLVSVTKLTEFAESHGSSCELKGATIGANIKLQRLYEKNEKIAIKNLLTEISKIENLVDVDISVISVDVHGVDMRLTLKAAKNLQVISEMVFNTLASLSLTKEEIEARKQLGLKSYENIFKCGNPYRPSTNVFQSRTQLPQIVFFTRNSYSPYSESYIRGVYDNIPDKFGIQSTILEYINDKINDYMVSCNISSPVNFEIYTSKSDNFVFERGVIPDYYKKYGHPLVSLKLEDFSPVSNSIWSIPFLSGRKKTPNSIFSYKDITGNTIGNIFYEYRINEDIINKLNGFFIEPVIKEPKVQENPPRSSNNSNRNISQDRPLPMIYIPPSMRKTR